MRRKLIIYLFAVIIGSSILYAGVLTWYSSKRESKAIQNEKEKLIHQLKKEYLYFYNLIAIAEQNLVLDHSIRLPKLSNLLISEYGGFKNIPLDSLLKYAQQIKVEHLYIISRNGEIINSTLSEEVGYNLRDESTGLRDKFDDLFNHNRVMSQSLGSSSVNKSIQFYTYYAPSNFDYVLEASIGLRALFAESYKKQIGEFPFYGSKPEMIRESKIIENFDLFNLIDAENISIIDTTLLSINDEQRDILLEKGSLSIPTIYGEDYYQIIQLNKNSTDFSEKFILSISFNYTAFSKEYWHLMKLNAGFFLIVLIIISALSLYVINRFFIQRVEVINQNLEAIKNANYDQVKGFVTKDELALIMKNIIKVKNNVMDREQQLIEAKSKAEESDRLKSSFLANMSHEIRTPLNAVVGFSQLLKGQFVEKDGVDQYVTLIIDNSDRLLRVINDVIDIAKIESKQLNFFIQETSLCNVFDFIEMFAVERIRMYAKLHNRSIINFNMTNLKPDVVLKTDTGRLKQVLENLLDNAAKFTESGSITLNSEIDSGFIWFSVTDTGIGIEEKDFDMIFNKFVHTADFLHKELQGTGLGLTISRELITQMGGVIKVESQIGKGSTFTFSLPL